MKNYFFITFTLLFVTFLNSSSILQTDFKDSDKIKGTWIPGSKTSKVYIFRATDNLYYGKIVYLNTPNDENGNPKKDNNNPISKLKNNPLLNLLILNKFKYNTKSNTWEDGTIYDPKNGKTYSCTINLNANGTLSVRGYVGISLLGRTDTWVKTSDVKK